MLEIEHQSSEKQLVLLNTEVFPQLRFPLLDDTSLCQVDIDQPARFLCIWGWKYQQVLRDLKAKSLVIRC